MAPCARRERPTKPTPWIRAPAMATTTMQPDIPWNVAGIAPEAREAARTSARREGLSVGEWLTRRILRGLPESGAAADQWWVENGPSRTPSNENPAQHGPQGNISDGLQNLLRRPNESRHNEGQGKSASARMAAQIPFAVRHDSETSDQLKERIVRLDARIAKIEIKAAAEGTKHAETVKALQAKIAELSGQISGMTARSAAQDAQLARAIEAVTGKFLQSSREAEVQQSAMEARMVTIAGDTALIGDRLEATQEQSERQLRAVEDRVAAMQAAVDVVKRDEEGVDRLGGSLDHLTQRFEASEAEYLNNIERFENRLTRIEANSGDATIDRRLQSIEQTLADMAKLIEKNTPEKPAPAAVFERSVSADKKSDNAELRDASSRAPAFGAAAAIPIPDVPPLPEKQKGNLAIGATGAPSTPDLRAAAQVLTGAPSGSSAPPRNTSFSWVDATEQKPAVEASPTRLILLGALGILVLTAIGAGVYLSTGLSRTPTVAHFAVKPAKYPVLAQGPQTGQPHASQLTALPGSSAKPVGVPVAAHSQAADMAQRPVRATRSVRVSARAANPGTPDRRLAALANGGHAKAQEVLGLAYLDGDGIAVNEAEGAKWLQRAAAQGEVVAAYRMGTLYERGHGVAADPAKAARWYGVAAKAGNRKAMHNLAVAYAQGSGVPKNLLLAVHWFSLAANLGLADSQFNLGVLYERGMGVSQSLPEAYKWYAIAAAQGDAESRSRMGVIAPRLRAADRAAADKSAAQFHPLPLNRAANTPPIAASLVGAG